MTIIKQEDLVQSIADALQFISYYHPVDYIQAVVPTRSKHDGREQQIAHVAASLKHLASKTGVPILTATQLNKEGEKTPRLSSVRESEAIANYSNIVLLLNPEERNDVAVDMDIIVAKNRDGAKDVATVVWERPLFTIRDLGHPSL